MNFISVQKLISNRVTRNAIFWFLFTFYHYSGSGNFIVHYFALLLVLLLSYGITAYVHNLIIIPRFLVRRKYFQYLLLMIPLVGITVVLSYYLTHFVNTILPNLNYMGSLKDVKMIYHIFPSLLMFALLAFGKFTSDAIQNQQKVDELNKQRLESLRSQVNPHFLFNALNTIYGLALRTDNVTATTTLKLSDILRYVLYEANCDHIMLNKELEFIKQYIAFARIRVHDQNDIQLVINGDLKEYQIAPLIMLPFIENAIKHGLGKHIRDGKVNINVLVENGKLSFTCINTNYNKREKEFSSHSGIGLKNVIRRLELLYPRKHTIRIDNDELSFNVKLNLELT
jgi:two-component system, LytTR family, sensor kinase